MTIIFITTNFVKALNWVPAHMIEKLNEEEDARMMRYLPYYAPYPPTVCYSRGAVCISPKQLQLSNTLRMLWEEHVAWTRMTIISIAEGLPDEEVVTKRLLRNATDMAAAFRPIYGDAIATKLGDLLTEHLMLAYQLVKAAKAGDSATAAKVEKQWYRNANDIAAFLASINPYWSKAQWETMLHDHLKLTKQQAVLRLSKDYVADVAIYDQIERQALEMADMMTAGIIKQFPAMFA